MGLSITEKDLLALLAEALFGVPSHREATPEILEEARSQTVLPLISTGTGEAMSIIANNIRVVYEHTELDQLLQGISYTTIKGAISAAYYPEGMLRTMGDVDFLVDPEDVDKVENLLIQNDFYTDNASHPCEKAFYRENSVWELHWEVNGIPGGKYGEIIREYLSDTIDTAIQVETPEGIYRAPDAFHHGLIMLLHNSHHMLSSGLGLRHLCDWAVFANKVDVGTLMREPLQACGLWRYAQLLTQLSVRYLGLSEQAWAMENVDDTLLEAMMEDIFKLGNFGRKNTEGIHEATLISDRERGNVGRNMFVQGVYSINEIVKRRIPQARERKYLLPAGWIYVGGRYIGRMLCGRRPKIHFRKTLEGANRRREIYSEFHLFE